MEFEAWSKEARDELLAKLSNPAYRKDMDAAGVDLRIAVLTMGETKSDLVERLPTLGQDHCFEIMERLGETAKRLGALAELAEGARLRIMAVACSHVIAQEGPI